VILTEHLLQRLDSWRAAPSWVLALSGGLDSCVLLHALATLASQHSLPPLRAVHVHHGLQSAADGWPDHCQQLCDALRVPLAVLHVQVQPSASLEQAARDARYAALSAALSAGEVLLTGQHQDDQAETLLLRLMRGAGVRGAAAMAEQRALGAGRLCRPLLSVSRQALLAYAQANGLEWVEDPSNADTRHGRNYMRHQVLPSLQARWPAASANLARSAGHFAEALGLLEALATEDLAEASTPGAFAWLPLPSLALAPLQALSEARQRNALQAWLAPLTRLPDTDHWAGWVAFREATRDAAPLWALTDGTLCRGAGRAWWLAGPWLQEPPPPPAWADLARPLHLPGNGTLTWEGGLPSERAQVRYRQGGERLQLPGRGNRDLKRLLNEAGVPGFLRGRLPLLFVEGQLLAVANLPGLSSTCGQLHWRPPTNDRCLR
jgi:tRNA(Ile)-lysidine synthase